MKDRLRELVRYKTNGKQKEFAEIFGWKPSYLGKMLAGTAIGIQPIMAILRQFPEISARWLLLGQGSMIERREEDILRHKASEHIGKVLSLEKYLSVMSIEERQAYERMVTAHEDHQFDINAELRWISILAERQMETDIKIKNAIDKSDEQCRQETAKK